MKDIIILAKAFNKASKRNSKFCPFAYNIKEVVCGLVSFEKFIFSHDFAKAFWGKEIICKDGSNWEDYLKGCLAGGMSKEEAEIDWEIDEDCFRIPYWQYHLQRMVLCEKPLKYLEGFLNESS